MAPVGEIEKPGKIYLGNLAIETDELVLEGIFKKYGRIKELQIIKNKETGVSKGFGFITFEDPENAEDAVKAMDGKEVDSNIIKASHALKSFSRSGDRGRGRGRGRGGRGGFEPRGRDSGFAPRGGHRGRGGPPMRSRGGPMRGGRGGHIGGREPLLSTPMDDPYAQEEELYQRPPRRYKDEMDLPPPSRGVRPSQGYRVGDYESAGLVDREEMPMQYDRGYRSEAILSSREARLPAREGQLPPREGRLPPREGRLPPREGRLPVREGRLPVREEHISAHEGRLPARDSRLPERRLPREGRLAPSYARESTGYDSVLPARESARGVPSSYDREPAYAQERPSRAPAAGYARESSASYRREPESSYGRESAAGYRVSREYETERVGRAELSRDPYARDPYAATAREAPPARGFQERARDLPSASRERDLYAARPEYGSTTAAREPSSRSAYAREYEKPAARDYPAERNGSYGREKEVYGKVEGRSYGMAERPVGAGGAASARFEGYSARDPYALARAEKGGYGARESGYTARESGYAGRESGYGTRESYGSQGGRPDGRAPAARGGYARR